MNADKIIHEARGLCWHELEFPDETDICCHCGEELIFEGYFYTNPDYAEPIPNAALMDWMRELEGTKNRAYLLDVWLINESHGICTEDWLNLTRQEQVTLIAEAILNGVLS